MRLFISMSRGILQCYTFRFGMRIVRKALVSFILLEYLILFCFVLFCFVLFCFVLFCFVLFCFQPLVFIDHILYFLGKVFTSRLYASKHSFEFNTTQTQPICDAYATHTHATPSQRILQLSPNYIVDCHTCGSPTCG